jgi:tRNA1Val (adenine37-N6)-methyltransferase
MPNPYFRFKEFTIHMDRCAMKVGTDGVLLGAWSDCSGKENVLDIGTGTGLIALMIAQRENKSRITAIELDEAAYIQAQENVLISPWKDRISVVHSSYQQFVKDCSDKFDLLVCNPPFFTQSFLSDDNERMMARHDSTLPLEELIRESKEIMAQNGSLAFVFPYDRDEDVKRVSEAHGFYIHKRLIVKPTIRKQPKRILYEIGPRKKTFQEQTLIIEDKGRHEYSDEYIALTKDFYLHF